MANETTGQPTPVYESPLAHINTTVEHPNWTVREDTNKCFVVLRGSLDNAQFAFAMSKVCGCGLPDRMHFNQSKNGNTIVWISPDEFLLIANLDEKDTLIEQAEQETADIFSSIIDNSGGYVKLNVSGNHYLDVLHKSAYYDLSPQSFQVGQVYSTHLSKAPAILFRENEHSISLLIRFSFADYIWRLLASNAEEYIN